MRLDPPLFTPVPALHLTTAAGVRDAIFGLKEAGTEAFVLDLRSNGGGSFPAGVEVARMLLNKGVVVYIADSAGVRDVVEAEVRENEHGSDEKP